MLVREAPLDGGVIHPEQLGGAAGALGSVLTVAGRHGQDLPCRSGDADLWFAEAPAELDMILPGQKETERQSRLEAMRREITDQGEQLSSKKRKRLDAFIVSLKFSIVSRSTDADLL